MGKIRSVLKRLGDALSVPLGWFGREHRLVYLLTGIAVGVLAMYPVGGIYGSFVCATALCAKDREYGGGWRWTRWALVFAGGIAGVAFEMMMRRVSCWHS